MVPEGAEAPNESGELAGYNLFSSHSALTEALAREGDLAGAADGELRARDMTQRLAAAFGTLPRGLDPQALMARAFL